ncbi:Moderate conductance mechanosensitive channel YbiO precursor [Roseisalinus antarcticus]|uniref:Moderate conductance mechanosensitive channel YbiO n=2 Tax=Roseisalinus antarcticus TaxID=254357 RepID=A0A1Y5U3U9_9RHOB|nr:Moderate conductance mechanosensitive channel YbiO precursor [Roseisalinus antarcticus]
MAALRTYSNSPFSLFKRRKIMVAMIKNMVLMSFVLLWPCLMVSAQQLLPAEAALDPSMSGTWVISDGNVLSFALTPLASEDDLDGEEETVIAKANQAIREFKEEARGFLTKASQMRSEIRFIVEQNAPDGTIGFFVKYLFVYALCLAIGVVFNHFVCERFFALPRLHQKLAECPVGYSEKIPVLAQRFFYGLGGTVLTAAIGYGLASVVLGTPENNAVEITANYLVASFVIISVVVLLWRMVFAPYLPNYRIPKFHKDDLEQCTIAAKKMFFWLTAGVILSLGVFLYTTWLQELGVSRTMAGLLSLYLSIGIVMFSVALLVANSGIVTGAILKARSPSEVSWPTRLLAGYWIAFAIGYVIIAWAVTGYRLVVGLPNDVPLISSGYAVLLTVLVVYALVSFVIEVFFKRRRVQQEKNITNLRAEIEHQSRMDNALDGEPDEGEITTQEIETKIEAQNTMTSFEDLAQRIAALVALSSGIYALFRIWRLDGLFSGNSVFGISYDVIFILFLGYIAYHFVLIWIDTKIRNEVGEVVASVPGDEGGAGGASRLATLLPLFRNFLLAVISVTSILIALTEMGFNVGPLFAGAGVVGLAIGFGSQTLVRDIFSGAFFLVDDAFRKGEYVDIGHVRGTVEGVSVRSFQLRHHLGPLHTVPFGEIQFLTNYSRDWVMMKLPLRVTYDTDVEKVRKLIKNLGQRLLEDPEIGEQFLQPLKSQGVIKMEDSAMIIRVKFMTKPGDQWVIRKRVYQDIRDIFEKEGIHFAHREVTVRVAKDNHTELTDLEKQTLGAAAILAEPDGGPAAPSGDDR